jgi:hypothetical protein
MLCERNNAALFLERIAADRPDMADALRMSAKYYRESSKFAGTIWEHVSMDDAGVKKFADIEIRRILADHVIQARDLEEKALQCLEELLT